MDKKTVEYYRNFVNRRFWLKRGSAPNFDNSRTTTPYNLNDSTTINNDISINDVSGLNERTKTPTPSEQIFYSYIRTPNMEDRSFMNESFQSNHVGYAKHSSIDFGDRSTTYDMLASTKGIHETHKGTSMFNLLESQNHSIAEEPVQHESKPDSKNVTYNNGFSETTSKLTGLRKKKDFAREALKIPTRKDEKMFSRENANAFINKIKMSMNRKDNKVANDVMKRFTNKNNGKRCISNLGIAPVEYTKPFPKFANMYSKAIEETVFELTHNLKKELESKNMEKMIKPKKVIPPEERPFLFELGLNMDDFVKRRGKKNIMTYVKETDEQIWELVTKKPEQINEHIRYSGDENLKQIFYTMKLEEKIAAQLQREREREREFEKNSTFLTTTGSFNLGRHQKKARTIFGYQHHDEKTSNYLINDTEKFLDKLKSRERKMTRFFPEPIRTTINT